MQHGVTYVPLRAVAESLGCQVTWDPRRGVQIWSSTPQLPTTTEAPVPGVKPYPRAAIPWYGNTRSLTRVTVISAKARALCTTFDSSSGLTGSCSGAPLSLRG